MFVTGATGFVGAALVLELLRARPLDRAFCVVRAANDDEATRRLHAALAAAADAYGADEDDLRSVLARAVGLRGDVTARRLGLGEAALARLAAAAPFHVWHCAASLKDAEDAWREIMAHNVGGAERVVELTLELGVEVFNHVSTAYVAGRTIGLAGESLARPRGFCNRYEQSKHYAEAIVRDNCEHRGVPYRILRPGIVVGHSVTGRATGYTGFLGWAVKLAVFAQATRGALARQSLRYVGRPDAELNLVPIDSVVEDCVGIDAAGARTLGGVFHLTNTAAPTVGWMADVCAEVLGLQPLHFVDDAAQLDALSRKFHRWTRFERPYVLARKQFARHDGNRLYESARHGRCPMSAEVFGKMVRYAVEDYRRQSERQQGAA